MLCHLLRQAGPSGDAFSMIASTWLCPGTPPAAVTKADREMAKRVTYGICYGLTPFGLAAALADQGVDVAAASKLLNSFLNSFRGGRAAGLEWALCMTLLWCTFNQQVHLIGRCSTSARQRWAHTACCTVPGTQCMCQLHVAHTAA
jgi:hypothetical protein